MSRKNSWLQQLQQEPGGWLARIRLAAGLLFLILALGCSSPESEPMDPLRSISSEELSTAIDGWAEERAEIAETQEQRDALTNLIEAAEKELERRKD